MAEGRDIIVMGGSAGALEAVGAVLAGLETEIPAAVFLVLHSSVDAPGLLADILSKRTPLAVRYAADHQPIELGAVYIAPPDRHLLVKPGEVRVVRGPKENNFRPAIDPLFRSAAYTYGSRVIGVVLSGLLDDGSHGVFQIKQQGGLAIAQSPDDSQQPSMPLAAIERVGVDHVAPAAEIGPLLNELTRGEDLPKPGPNSEQADVAEGMASGLRVHSVPTPTSPFICPECGGALWEIEEGKLLRYRCHTGHGMTADTLFALQSTEVEQALWTSVRLLEEQAELQKRMAQRWSAPRNQGLRRRFEANAEDRAEAAELIRGLVTGRPRGPERPEASPNVRYEYGT